MNENLKKWYDLNVDKIKELCDYIWKNPEAPYEEYLACERISCYLRENGFNVRTYNIKDDTKPSNAVLASWGSGKPVIGIIGEYDALIGLGQDAVPYRKPMGKYGHACGHSLMTPATASAAIAMKYAMQAEGLEGTIKFFATPAEEVIDGKIIMAANGDFDGLDACFFWHPMAKEMTPSENIMLSLIWSNIEFFGVSAHAANDSEKGRNALYAAELMNIGLQFLRDHIPNDYKIHYCYTSGGDIPSTVPAYAALEYIVRAKNMHRALDAFEWVKQIARGAAMMTGTSVKVTIRSGVCETFILPEMNRFCYESSKKVPRPVFSREAEDFGRELYKNFTGEDPEGSVLYSNVKEPSGIPTTRMASTDVGFVTRNVPTCRFFGLGFVKSSPMHHWSAVASTGSEIGTKSALYASQILAQCMYDVLNSPERIQEWKKQLAELRQGTEDYIPIVQRIEVDTIVK
jgi:aminobenzoyl-glutamate utilization protein B